MNERTQLVAPCGIDCGICEMYTCKDSPEMIEYFVSKGVSRDELPCKGCIAVNGKCPMMGSDCETYSCAKQKQVSSCSSCNDFPCEKLAPSADRANILPHNMKVFNLSMIKKMGLDGFTKESARIKQLYYKGKMVIGAGPKLDE